GGAWRGVRQARQPCGKLPGVPCAHGMMRAPPERFPMAVVPELPLTDTVLRLGLATILGALVGLERERLERAAGIRTHAIVSLGAALIMIVSMYGFSDVL